MTREEIIRMARQAGLHSAVLLHLYDGKEAALTDSEHDELRRLERFAALIEQRAAAAEREACAQVCNDLVLAHPGRADLTAEQCAAAIRARGEKP